MCATKRFRALLMALALAAVAAGPCAAAAVAADPYGGSKSCRECHEKFYSLWSTSHHGLAMQPVTPAFVKAELTPLTNALVIGTNRYRVQFNADGARLSEERADGTSTYPLVHAMGGKNVYYFLTPLERGRLQVLPVAYDVRKHEWYDAVNSMARHAFPETPLAWTDRLLTFNTSCHNCHVSQLSVNYDGATDSYHSEWKEPGINCESCHGPAEEHNRVMRAAPSNTVPADVKIISTKSFSVQQKNDACLTCHAKGAPITATYPPGTPFFDHFDLTTLEDLDFYPDGRDLGENYTMTTWLMSPCAKSGKLSCMHCHTSSGRFRQADAPNQACMPCHANYVTNETAHTHHKPGTHASMCVSCHMPMTEFARMRRSDHSMRPPAPAATAAFGSPNACNTCHPRKSAAWADAKVREWRTRDYQAPILEAGHLVAAARTQDWRQLDAMLAYLQRAGRDDVVACSLLRLLVRCPNPRKWPVIEQSLTNSAPLVRSAAAAALSGSPRIESVAALATAVRDTNRLVRIRAADALAEAPPEMILPNELAAVAAASKELEESLTARPDQWHAHYNLGNYYLARGELKAAAAAFERGHELRPDTVMPLVNASIVYARLGRSADAEAALQDALKLDDTSAAAHFNLGLLLAEKGDARAAETHLRRALQSDPQMAEAAYNLGVLLADNRLNEALVVLKQAAALRPDNPRYGYTYAFYLYHAGRIAEALQTLKPVRQQYPAYTDAAALEQQLRRELPR